MLLGNVYLHDNAREQALEQYNLVLELEQDHPQRIRVLNRIRGQEETTGATIAGKQDVIGIIRARAQYRLSLSFCDNSRKLLCYDALPGVAAG